ncbi:aldo/keto reductase [Dactylosporangium sp. McL0621]|uniref:aldo/keto reductase n=1 Tax=Dactylosporangium sp. McL0621 TaxID=3415678 RepID=UPI003CE99914
MTGSWTNTRNLGSTGLEVTSVCVGGSPLGSMPHLYGYEVSAEQAVAAVEAVFDGPFNFLDTSNAYSDGDSERRIGEAIRRRGGLPPGFVLATKVDGDRRTGDYSGARVRRSAEESLERLGLDHFELLHLHDPEVMPFDAAAAPGGPVEALVELRDRGLASYIGVAGGNLAEMAKYVATGAFDVLLTHNRYTLLDRSAEAVIGAAGSRGMGVINAAPYGGGMLAKGPGTQPRYAYGLGDISMGGTANAMQAACQRYGVPLAAAALQFSTRDPRIDSTVVGISTPARVAETAALLNHAIPTALWDELEALTPPRELWIG